VIFLDTNVVSEVMRPKPAEAVLLWLELNIAELALSAVVIAEISFGIERIRPAERAPRLARAFASVRERFAARILAFDEDSATIYGVIMGEASRKGRTLSMLDGMIAATAMRYSATMATRNRKDFDVLGLKVVNPWG
jgi:predicted nucleic acid-binding protein